MYWKVRNCYVIKGWLSLLRRGGVIWVVTQRFYPLREASRTYLDNRCLGD